MGLMIAGTVTVENPLIPTLSPLSNIIAFWQAHIGKSLLENWVDLTQLQTNYPSKVIINNSMVSLKGPVAILKSVKTAKVGLAILAGIAGAYLLYQLSKAVINFSKERNIQLFKDINDEQMEEIAKIAAGVAFMIFAGAAYVTTHLLLPLEPGIYFF